MSSNSRLAFLVNFEIADAILDISKITGWELAQTTKKVYATNNYQKWMDVSTDYCKYAYPIKLTSLCEELHISSIYS
jgi:hypothetical protein